jgi:hypothetical protein
MSRKNTPLLILIFAALIIFIATSCEDRVHDSSQPTELSDVKDVEVMVYDNCEYVVAGRGKYQWGAHKGNCSNPIHER